MQTRRTLAIQLPTKGNLMSCKPTVNREEREVGREVSAAGGRVTTEGGRATEEVSMAEVSVAEVSVTREEKREESVAWKEKGTVEGKDKTLKVVYQNVGRSIEATNILLARGREEKWDLVFAAESWEGRRGERTT